MDSARMKKSWFRWVRLGPVGCGTVPISWKESGASANQGVGPEAAMTRSKLVKISQNDFCDILRYKSEKNAELRAEGGRREAKEVKNGVQASQAAFYRGFCIFQASQGVSLGRLGK